MSVAGRISMRPSLWGLAIVAFGLAGIVFAGGNLILLGFSGLFILVGLLVVTVAEIVRWSQSHVIFGPPKTYVGLVATPHGETVRSNSERMIADYFYQNNGLCYLV